MSEPILLIPVTDIERRIIINALEKLKQVQIAEKKQYDSIDDIILNLCDAKVQKTRTNNRVYETR